MRSVQTSLDSIVTVSLGSDSEVLDYTLNGSDLTEDRSRNQYVLLTGGTNIRLSTHGTYQWKQLFLPFLTKIPYRPFRFLSFLNNINVHVEKRVTHIYLSTSFLQRYTQF